MLLAYDIIKTLLRTEKGISLVPQRKYFFEVAKKANKIQIKKAIEEIYNVKVENVNTSIMPGKIKRVRREQGYTPDWKKASITLKEGNKIEVAS